MSADPGMGADAGASAARQPREERPGDALIVAALFALAFAYDTVEAVTNLQQLPLLFIGADIEASIPWWLLIAQVALPAVLFAAALWVGRRMRLVAKAGVLLAALAVSAQLSLLAEQVASLLYFAAPGG
ncbi:MAG: hypothetical protein ACQEWM_10880 [Actinomycetota bacterium]